MEVRLSAHISSRKVASSGIPGQHNICIRLDIYRIMMYRVCHRIGVGVVKNTVPSGIPRNNTKCHPCYVAKVKQKANAKSKRVPKPRCIPRVYPNKTQRSKLPHKPPPLQCFSSVFFSFPQMHLLTRSLSLHCPIHSIPSPARARFLPEMRWRGLICPTCAAAVQAAIRFPRSPAPQQEPC